MFYTLVMSCEPNAARFSPTCNIISSSSTSYICTHYKCIILHVSPTYIETFDPIGSRLGIRVDEIEILTFEEGFF